MPSSLQPVPLELKLTYAGGDTTVRVFQSSGTDTFRIATSRNVESITVDPNGWLLCKVGRVSRGTLIVLDAPEIDLGDIRRGVARFDTTFTVRNIGSEGDSVSMSVDPVNVEPASAVEVSPMSFFLAPGDSQIVTVTVYPPRLQVQYYQMVITAQPQSDLAQGSISTSVLFHILKPDVVQDEEQVPTIYSLGQNYPNPFNPSTTIRYGLPARSHVSLTVVTTLGQQVCMLQNGEQDAGYHEVRFDGTNLPSGVYFYRLQVRPSDSDLGRDSRDGAGGYTEAKKLLLIR